MWLDFLSTAACGSYSSLGWGAPFPSPKKWPAPGSSPLPDSKKPVGRNLLAAAGPVLSDNIPHITLPGEAAKLGDVSWASEQKSL